MIRDFNVNYLLSDWHLSAITIYLHHFYITFCYFILTCWKRIRMYACMGLRHRIYTWHLRVCKSHSDKRFCTIHWSGQSQKINLKRSRLSVSESQLKMSHFYGMQENFDVEQIYKKLFLLPQLFLFIWQTVFLVLSFSFHQLNFFSETRASLRFSPLSLAPFSSFLITYRNISVCLYVLWNLKNLL